MSEIENETNITTSGESIITDQTAEDRDTLRSAVRERLQQTAKNEIISNIYNFCTILKHDPTLQGRIKENLLTERTDIDREGLSWSQNTPTLTDTDFDYMMFLCEQCYGISNEKKLRSAVRIVAHQNKYHPIREKLESLVWDKTPRIRHCLKHFLGAAEDDYTETVFLHFMLGAIRRVYSPGTKFEEVLCLVGGQGIGKSTFFRFLAINDEWFSDDIRRLDDERVYERLQGHWIIEMSEMLATNNAKSVEESRSFLSRQKDTYRTPYGTQAFDHPRQCVFAGTSNSKDFLPLDRAGNRRFLPIITEVETPEVHILENEAESRAYILQVWAEVMEIYKSGEYSMRLPKVITDRLLETQKSCMPEDDKAGIILGFLESYKGDKVCCRLLYEEALHQYDDPKKWQLHEISEIMNNYAKDWKHFDNPRNFGPRYGKQKGWERIVKLKEEQPAGNQPQATIVDNGEAVQMGMPLEWVESSVGCQ